MNSRTRAITKAVILVVIGLTNHYSTGANNADVTGAELNEFGVYRRYGLRFETPPHTKERHYTEMREPTLLKKGDVIPAALGTTFGIRYTITGEPEKTDVNVVIEVAHPPTVDSKTGKKSTLEKATFKESIGAPAYTDMLLDMPQSVVAGKWTFRVINDSKVLLEKSFEVTEARKLTENEATVIEGVPVFGRVHAVTADDIRDVIKEVTDNSSSESKKPGAIEVLTADEIHAYLPEREMGWLPIRLGPVVEPDGRVHLAWGICSFAIQDTPEVLRVIRNADQIFVFPSNSSKPHRDDQHMRLLESKAQTELKRLLGHRNGWFQGHYSIILVKPVGDATDAEKADTDESGDIGFVFKKGQEEVILFFSGSVGEGTVNGESTKGMVDDKRADQLERWKKRYAKPELAAK